MNDCNSSKDMPCPCKAGYAGDHCEKCSKEEGFTGFDGIEGQVDPDTGVGITCNGICYSQNFSKVNKCHFVSF